MYKTSINLDKLQNEIMPIPYIHRVKKDNRMKFNLLKNKQNRLHALFSTIILSLLAVLNGCNNKAHSANDKADGINNDDTFVDMMEQNYERENIVEIPMIMYDGQQPTLAEYGGKNPEIEMLNNDIKANLMLPYNDFEDSDDKDSWIQIRTYPITNNQMIQLIISNMLCPNYGTDGDIVSYNFDKTKNEWVGLDTVFEQLGISRNTIETGAKNAFVPEYEGEYVDNVEVQGFRYINGDSVDFFLKIFVINPDADPWNGLYRYSYTPKSQTLNKLNMEQPFNVSELDVMNPPLYYGRK